MDPFVVILNILFLIVSVLLVEPSAERIIRYRSSTIADYVVVLIAIFNCLPVLMDVFFGIPNYVYWYRVFEDVLGEFTICFIYNAYTVFVLAVIQFYAYKVSKEKKELSAAESVCLSGLRPLAVDVFLILLPVLYCIYKYGFSVFAGYRMLSGRGVESGDSTTINQMITLSVFLYATRFFSKPRRIGSLILMTAYFFVLIWLNGKRYMLVTIGEIVFFLYQMTKKEAEKRINLGPLIVWIAAFVIIFSAYYLTNIKVNSASQYLYGTLRVDFGRDDVTKFVIDRVLLEKKQILDYPGQSVISDLLMFVPRRIWANKPYPHYRYLTAAILGLNIYDIPAGTTPSIFEMNLCNFGWLGIPVTAAVIVGLCAFSDKNHDLSVKVIMLLILTNLLSQALDAVMILIPVLVLHYLATHIQIDKHLLLVKTSGK